MYKLFILDDEDEIRNGLKNYFPWQDVGFQVVGDSGEAKSALVYLQTHPVDVLMTDIRMPDISGIDLIRTLRQQNTAIQIVVLSGYRDFEYARQAMEMGIKYYLVKPTKYSQLTEVFSDLRQQLEKNANTAIPAPAAADAISDEDNLVIRKIKHYIKSHYAQASLDSVALHVRMNPYYLSSYFHQQTGEKFYDYLLRVRMREAARLLCESDLHVQKISEEIGYSSANSFSRTFRQYYQLSPKDYRKLNGTRPDPKP